MKNGEKKIIPPFRDSIKTYMGYIYLLHVNTMPGYFENQDTTQAKEKQILHHDKKANNDHIISRI